MTYRRRLVRDINLLPKEFSKRPLWKPAGVAAAVVCLSAALAWLPYQLRERNEAIRALIEQNERQARISAPVLTAFRQLAEVEADVKERSALAGRSTGWLWLEGVLARTPASVSEGVNIERIGIPAQGAVVIEGNARDLAALLGTVRRLEAEAGFKGTELELPREFEDGVQYRVTAVVD